MSPRIPAPPSAPPGTEHAVGTPAERDAAARVSGPARATVAARPGEPGLFLALAPMDGVTDHVYRELLTAERDGHSGISLCVSEFVRVTAAAVQPHVLLRDCPELRHGGRTRAGVPVFVQLLGGEPAAMAGSAQRAAELGAPGIDLNFGCPAKTVNRHDGGAALLKAPCRVEAVTAAVRAAVDRVDPAIPVTAKIRLGWDDAADVAAIAQAAARGGASWLTIHARTRVQQYHPPVDHDAVGRARAAVAIPVVANGDLFTPADLTACAARSGCDAFMIGRGAMARPRLFAAARGWEPDTWDLAEFRARLLDYAARLLAAGASERAAVGRVKQWLRLAVPQRPALQPTFDASKPLATLEALRACLERAPPALAHVRGNPAVGVTMNCAMPTT